MATSFLVYWSLAELFTGLRLSREAGTKTLTQLLDEMSIYAFQELEYVMLLRRIRESERESEREREREREREGAKSHRVLIFY